jgi:hypothetical protein
MEGPSEQAAHRRMGHAELAADAPDVNADGAPGNPQHQRDFALCVTLGHQV